MLALHVSCIFVSLRSTIGCADPLKALVLFKRIQFDQIKVDRLEFTIRRTSSPKDIEDDARRSY